MSQPTPFVPATDFSEEEATGVSGRSTVRTAALDALFSALQTTLDQTLANLAILQRDDLALTDSLVTIPSLSPQVLALIANGAWTMRGSWVTATDYAAGDIVLQNDTLYVCVVAHTSGTFATDLAADKWGQMSAFPLVTAYMQTVLVAATAAIARATLFAWPGANVKDYGAVGDGATNDTAAILAADVAASKVFYPKGTYKFTGDTNPTFASGIEVDTVTWTGAVVTDTLAFDSDGKTLVGLHHNHPQTTGTGTAITSGKIVAPPLSKGGPRGIVDVIAHWYGPWGTEGIRIAYPGSPADYDWSWNHVGVAGYRASRHPLLGWYRNDDPNVIDWQCYWLRENGVTAIIPVGLLTAANMATWSTASDEAHWLYQLYNNVPNFNGLRYIPWVEFDFANVGAATAQWQTIINDVLAVYPNTYTMEKNGKSYVCVFTWWSDAMRIALGVAASIAFLKARAAEAQAIGYDGLCVMARLGTDWEAWGAGYLAELEADGVLYFPTQYETTDNGNITGPDYSDYVDQYTVLHQGWIDRPQIVGVASSLYSIGVGAFTYDGSTPELFRSLLQKAIRGIVQYNFPRILTIYNVSEWREGGPGLNPNRQDGFGYLQAVRDAIVGSAPSANIVPVVMDWNPIITGDTVTAKTCTAISRSGTTVTFTITGHTYAVGDGVAVSGTNAYNPNNPGFDGGYKVATAPDANTVTATVTADQASKLPAAWTGSVSTYCGYIAGAGGWWRLADGIVQFGGDITGAAGTINALITGNARIMGLPFASRNSAAEGVAVPVLCYSGVDLPAGAVDTVGFIASNSAAIDIYCGRDNAAALEIAVGATGVTNAAIITFSGAYRTH